MRRYKYFDHVTVSKSLKFIFLVLYLFVDPGISPSYLKKSLVYSGVW